jgi:Domain of unknown function DUF29
VRRAGIIGGSGKARFRVVLTTGIDLIRRSGHVGAEEEEPMPGNPAQLYEEDFVRWTQQQAAALRDAASLGTNLRLDWENLAEEIDSLGRSQKHALRSRLAVILEHLLKLGCSPATDPRRSWMETLDRERSEIELLLRDSPSLGNEVSGIIAEENARSARRAIRTLHRHGEATPEVVGKITAPSYTEDQVLGDWFPGDAPLPANGERE